MKRYTLALDLIDDPQLIQEYVDYHQNVWPEVKESIKQSGILDMTIYRFENRLFMIMDVDNTFSFEKKNLIDQANQKVQEWEKLMWKYQKSIPGANPNEKWVLMDKIFEL